MRFVVSAACLLGVGGHAGAESAHEFWQNEWQRQTPRVSSLDRSEQGQGAFQEQRGWSAEQKPSGHSRALGGQSSRSGNFRPLGAKMPTVRVNNPDFFTYVPDKLTNVALGSVCEFQTSANAAANPPDSGGSEAPAGAALSSDSSPSAAYAQACATSPAISLRMLPQVGKAIARHYSQRPQFLWSDQGGINAKAHAAIATLAAIDAVGLDP